jgi:hypothetical protein
MKKSSILSVILSALVLCSSLIFMNCEGPAGATGPAGPAGPTGAAGPAGPAGAAGQNGNANVIQFSYAARTWTNTVGNIQTFVFTNLPAQSQIASAFFAYVGIPVPANNTTDWFLVPGRVKTGTTVDFGEYNTWVNAATSGSSTYVIRRETLGTSGALTAPVRIVIIPANDLRNGRKAPVDFSDYNAVKAYYGLKD